MSTTKLRPAKSLSGHAGRNERIIIRVKKAEKRKFYRLVKSRHTDLSELVRQLLHREVESKGLKAGA